MNARKRDLIGRKIVAVEWNRHRADDDPKSSRYRDWVTDPVLVLDNGARIYFTTQETELGFYGVRINLHAPRRPTRACTCSTTLRDLGEHAPGCPLEQGA
jgi:hypothetical protein